MPSAELQEQLVKYLTDVHALEQNALTQLNTAVEQAGDRQLTDVFRRHVVETEEHERLIGERLAAYSASPSALKEVAHKGGAMVTGALAKAAPDTTGKLLLQAYATEHLEIASYRMLSIVAQRAEDQETYQVAQRILEQERSTAQQLDGLLEPVAEHDLRDMGVAA
jgi:ferritin-like metal-binding protein YciE